MPTPTAGHSVATLVTREEAMTRLARTLLIPIILTALMAGCKPAADTRELRILTPEQEAALFEQAERIEIGDVVKESIKNDEGIVIQTITSQTQVVFMRAGGPFSVATSCYSSCGPPLEVDPGGKITTCEISGCMPKGGACTKATCTGDTCTPSCSKLSIGFGDFSLLAW